MEKRTEGVPALMELPSHAEPGIKVKHRNVITVVVSARKKRTGHPESK